MESGVRDGRRSEAGEESRDVWYQRLSGCRCGEGEDVDGAHVVGRVGDGRSMCRRIKELDDASTTRGQGDVDFIFIAEAVRDRFRCTHQRQRLRRLEPRYDEYLGVHSLSDYPF